MLLVSSVFLFFSSVTIQVVNLSERTETGLMTDRTRPCGPCIAAVATRPRGYKTFFVLNSVEQEVLNAHKYKNIKKFGLFKAQLSTDYYFFPLIHVKMPTIVGILTFMSGENSMLK